MDIFEHHKREAQRRYDNDVAAAKSRLEEALRAIEVLQRLDETSPYTSSTHGAEKAPTKAPSRAATQSQTIRSSLREAIKTLLPQIKSQHFTNHHVLELLQKLDQPAEHYGVVDFQRGVRDTLRRMEGQEVFVYREGKGRRATVYTLDPEDKAKNGFGLV